MSTHSHNENHHNDHEQVESSSIKAKPILIFLGALGAMVAMVFVIIKGVEFGLKKVDEMNRAQPATQLSTGAKLPPEPRLQGAPEPDPNKPGSTRASLLPLDDMKAYREQVNEKAASYEWVDKQGGVARIPIERAKQLVAEKGLLLRPETAIGEMQAAEAVRKEVYNSDSSAGRLIKSQKAVSAPQLSAPPPPVAGHEAGQQPDGEVSKPEAKAQAAGAKH